MIIDLPKNYYKILNPPAPPRWAVVTAIAGIIVVSLAWAIVGG